MGLLIGYLVVINSIGFVIMGIDKAKARRQKWRISEKTLFATAILGGSLGIWSGMYIFRHKTKHWYFVVGIPVILILEILLVVMCIVK